MTIERVEVRAVGPEVPRYSWASNLPEQHITLTTVRVFDADGAEGLGATPSYSSHGFDLSVLETLRPLLPRVVGKDPLQREQIWHELQDFTLPKAPGALSALDIALWDLTAQRAGLPLYQLLGGARSEIIAYASTPLLPGPKEYVQFVHELRDEGFRAVKFHAWCEPDRDLEMLRAVQAEHGDARMAFMHDAEQRYTRPSALRVARELEEMSFHFFEAPLDDFDLTGYRELRRRVGVPILPGGNTILDIQHVYEALRLEPWDAIRIDVTVAGGLTPARKIAALAEAAGVWVELQSWGSSLIQAANLHLGLAMQRTGFFELPVPGEAYEFGVENPFHVRRDGTVSAPPGSGLGMVVDWERMQSATLGSCSLSSATRGTP